MIKIFNFKCEKCNYEIEEFIDTAEKIEYVKTCPKCKSKMKIFNLKNNCGRWRYVDSVRGD